jgi:hypothetical protein
MPVVDAHFSLPPQEQQRFTRAGLPWALSSLQPVNLHFSAIGQTVAQVQINQTLVRHTSLIRHCFEMLHQVFWTLHPNSFQAAGNALRWIPTPLYILPLVVNTDRAFAQALDGLTCLNGGMLA